MCRIDWTPFAHKDLGQISVNGPGLDAARVHVLSGQEALHLMVQPTARVGVRFQADDALPNVGRQVLVVACVSVAGGA